MRSFTIVSTCTVLDGTSDTVTGLVLEISDGAVGIDTPTNDWLSLSLLSVQVSSSHLRLEGGSEMGPSVACWVVMVVGTNATEALLIHDADDLGDAEEDIDGDVVVDMEYDAIKGWMFSFLVDGNDEKDDDIACAVVEGRIVEESFAMVGVRVVLSVV